MADTKKKTVTFKVDAEMAERLRSMPNSSEFIREAVAAALADRCPLCQGSGRLTEQQSRHWQSFTAHHAVERCEQCQAVHLVCHSGTGCPAH